MAEPKLLISDEDWAEIQRIALERKTRGQTLMRDAVLNWLHGDRRDLRATGPPADTAKLRRAAAAARQLAEDLDAAAGTVPDSEPTLTISYSALISMIQEIRKHGPDTLDSTHANIAERVRARLGGGDTSTAADSSSTARSPRGKRGAVG